MCIYTYIYENMGSMVYTHSCIIKSVLDSGSIETGRNHHEKKPSRKLRFKLITWGTFIKSAG